MTTPRPCMLALAAVLLTAAAAAIPARGQLSERPGNSLDDPVDTPHDLSGLSIKNPRVRVVHTTDPRLAGGSMYLQQVDPWLGFQLGRNLTQREFRRRDGVYGDDEQTGKLDGIILPDGATKMMSRGHVNSCAVCHNTPFRDGGAGATIPKNGGEGRNTPHMFGAGLLEMLGLQLRLKAMAIADANRDGWISFDEMKAKRCVINNLPDGVEGRRSGIDYGSFDDANGDGRPDLNPLFNPIYVDDEGKRIAFAASMKHGGVAGYKFEVQCFGFGHLYMPFRPPVSPTLRSFIATPFDIHSGLQACDPTTLNDPDGDGWSQVSNAGALQCLTAVGKDRGAAKGPTGISKDDPDRDGYCEEITEGDLDLAEWYLLNHPAPTRAKVTDEVKRGERIFSTIGCAACHVPDWHLHAAGPGVTNVPRRSPLTPSPGTPGEGRGEGLPAPTKVTVTPVDVATVDYTEQYDGDRRFFELLVGWNDEAERMEGKVAYLADQTDDGRLVPRRGAYTIRGLYSDLKYHDVGEAFYQVQYDGTVVRKWRTSPLWGVGSTAPYGHDGANLSLDEVIRRHGGDALASRKAYAKLKDADRSAVIAFLNNLVLYQTDRLPCDIDGDGAISERFVVADEETGLERFNPEWLFKVPGKIEGPTESVKGDKIVSFALTNVDAAYGCKLQYLADTDRDGFPDVIDPDPKLRGYCDGVK